MASSLKGQSVRYSFLKKKIWKPKDYNLLF